MKGLFSLFALLFVTCSSAQEIRVCDTLTTVNLQVLESAKNHLGKKVLRGECWDLVSFALNEAKADWDGYLAFGKEINPHKECIMPGDVVEFRKCKFSTVRGNVTSTMTMEKHYGIVFYVPGNNSFVLLHQNFGSTKKVLETEIPLNDLVKGSVIFYRPQQL